MKTTHPVVTVLLFITAIVTRVFSCGCNAVPGDDKAYGDHIADCQPEARNTSSSDLAVSFHTASPG